MPTARRTRFASADATPPPTARAISRRTASTKSNARSLSVRPATESKGAQRRGYSVGPILGHGTHGTVFHGMRRTATEKEYLAIKIVQLPATRPEQRAMLAETVNEIEVLRRINHDNVASYKDSFIQDREVFIRPPSSLLPPLSTPLPLSSLSGCFLRTQLGSRQ